MLPARRHLPLRLCRSERAVVLGIASGKNHLLLYSDNTKPLPKGWLAVGSDSSWAHGPSLAAAEQLAHHLEASGTLQRLIGGDGSGGLPDATGWQLVLAGHGLGGGAAALLALKLQPEFPSEWWCARACGRGQLAWLASADFGVVVGNPRTGLGRVGPVGRAQETHTPLPPPLPACLQAWRCGRFRRPPSWSAPTWARLWLAAAVPRWWWLATT